MTDLLFDPALSMFADHVLDLERVRIAAENRLRQLTRVGEDKDGKERGFGFSDAHPAVLAQNVILIDLRDLEHRADLNLQRQMRLHPLGPWIKAQKGLGDRQAARLLGTIGDPYWNTLHDRPRTVSELWAYSGLHVLPADHRRNDPVHGSSVDGDQTSDPGQGTFVTHLAPAGVAARRRKGVKSNWSTAAKMRAYLVAESCMKGLRQPCGRDEDTGDKWAVHVDGCTCYPYRRVYDTRREHTAQRTHVEACARCGPAGKPATPGSPWSAAHAHADALRIVSKELLKDLWIEARRLHEAAA